MACSSILEAEKLRYITGYSVAVHSDGRQVCVDLDHIYVVVAALFGVSADAISRAAYQAARADRRPRGCECRTGGGRLQAGNLGSLVGLFMNRIVTEPFCA